MTDPSQLRDIDDEIVEQARQRWEDRKVPLLLSELGSMEDGKFGAHAKREYGSLQLYLVNRLKDHIRVVSHSSIPPMIGVVPATEEGDMDDAFDRLSKESRDRSSSSGRFYHPAFWFAFVKPLDTSNRRYLSPDDSPWFQDTTSEEAPDGFVEVERKYIANSGIETLEIHSNISEIHSNISSWCTANNLDPERFRSTKESNKPRKTRLPSEDLLGRVLILLDTEDLKRISMPLDIVKKLRQESL